MRKGMFEDNLGSPKKSLMAQAMRDVINSSRPKMVQAEAPSEKKPIMPIEQAEQKTIHNKETKNALDHLRAPRPRPHQQIIRLVDLSNETLAHIPNAAEKSPDKISARLDKKFRLFLDAFKPLTLKSKSSAGLGRNIEYLIQDYYSLLSEQKEHLKEAMDFLRQTQNAEIEYGRLFQSSGPEEVQAKKKFQDAINTLRLVLNLKKLTDHKLIQFMDRGILSRAHYLEIHYYLNFQVYEKWEERGV
jgi:hypothetical protein